MKPRIVLLFRENTILVDFATSTPFPPGLGGETVDDSDERVVGGFARGAADDDGAAIADNGGLVVVGLGACGGVEAESACVVSGEKHW